MNSSSKRSNVESHVKSAKHVESRKAVEQRQVREKDIAEALQRHTEVAHQKGETLPEEQRIHRLKPFYMLGYLLLNGISSDHSWKKMPFV